MFNELRELAWHWISRDGGEMRLLDDEDLRKKFKSFFKKLEIFCMAELVALGHKSAIENRVL